MNLENCGNHLGYFNMFNSKKKLDLGLSPFPERRCIKDPRLAYWRWRLHPGMFRYLDVVATWPSPLAEKKLFYGYLCPNINNEPKLTDLTPKKIKHKYTTVNINIYIYILTCVVHVSPLYLYVPQQNKQIRGTRTVLEFLAAWSRGARPIPFTRTKGVVVIAHLSVLTFPKKSTKKTTDWSAKVGFALFFKATAMAGFRGKVA